jgi:protein-L-isoaspartate(D-aspartate) O-methyltransferase
MTELERTELERTDLARHRRFYAEEIEAVANLQSSALIEALATVPRERFLPPGPWIVRGETDYFVGTPRSTPDDHPRRVYHNLAIAIDASRQLFNGAPSLLALCIDRLALERGHRVLHVGCGLGYYTALMAHTVGPGGRVVAIDIDETLAPAARRNLAGFSQAEVRQGDGTLTARESFDAVLVNAGVTHPLEEWLDAVSPGGRLILPLTATFPAMGTIGKGPLLLLTKRDRDFDASLLTLVAIYSAIGIRDPGLNERLGAALTRGASPRLRRLRRDAHDESPACWLHGPGFCMSE